MASLRDIHNAARYLVKQHGREAERFAALNADHLADQEDETGAAHWQSIAEVVRGIEAGITAARA